jgi:hypothetical protein
MNIKGEIIKSKNKEKKQAYQAMKKSNVRALQLTLRISLILTAASAHISSIVEWK